jgi:hypothetical protein
MQNFFTVAVPLVAMVTTNTATLPSVFPPPPVEDPKNPPFSIIQEDLHQRQQSARLFQKSQKRKG